MSTLSVIFNIVVALGSMVLGLWLGRKWQAFDDSHPLRVKASWVRPKLAKKKGLASDYLEVRIRNRSSRDMRIGRVSFVVDSVDAKSPTTEISFGRDALSLEIDQGDSDSRAWLFDIGSQLQAMIGVETDVMKEDIEKTATGRAVVGRIRVYDHDTKHHTDSAAVRLLLMSPRKT